MKTTKNVVKKDDSKSIYDGECKFFERRGEGGGGQGVLCKNSLLADLFGSQHLLEI